MEKKRIFAVVVISIILVLFLNPISLVVLWLFWGLWSNSHPDMGVNVKQVSWLPREAINVSYYKTYSNTFYEFDISENGFKKWASDWMPEKISEPVKIRRYTAMTEKPPEHSGNVWTEKDMEAETHYQEYVIYATIKKGYYFRTPPRGNGGGTYVAYDLEKGRAYFFSCPR